MVQIYVNIFMKAHQRLIRENAETKTLYQLFDAVPKNISLKSAVFKQINYLTAKPIIEEHEWIGTMPLPKSCRFMYGVYFDEIMGGCIVYVEPSTRQFNKEYPRKVVQLNRGACVWWTPKNTASWLISKSFKELKKEGIVAVVAYCTPEAGEFGTIYQACNFTYTGLTQKSKSYFLDNHWVSERTMADKIAWAKTKDSRWMDAFKGVPSREQKPKHRYFKLIGHFNDNKNFIKAFDIKTLPYPKRLNNIL